MSGSLFCRRALLPHGWADDVLIEWNAAGMLTAVTPRAQPDGAPVAELVLPGMVNLHSHAFQRALGGLTEIAGDSTDSFWTWRDLMYRFARNITPAQIEAIAAQLFAEPTARLYLRLRVPLRASRAGRFPVRPSG